MHIVMIVNKKLIFGYVWSAQELVVDDIKMLMLISILLSQDILSP